MERRAPCLGSGELPHRGGQDGYFVVGHHRRVRRILGRLDTDPLPRLKPVGRALAREVAQPISRDRDTMIRQCRRIDDHVKGQRILNKCGRGESHRRGIYSFEPNVFR